MGLSIQQKSMGFKQGYSTTPIVNVNKLTPLSISQLLLKYYGNKMSGARLSASRVPPTADSSPVPTIQKSPQKSDIFQEAHNEERAPTLPSSIGKTVGVLFPWIDSTIK